jgi:hypothetical protein
VLIPSEDIPVFINNFNRLSAMREMVDWLRSAGTKHITILDNDSTYRPLLDYYDVLPAGVDVMYLGRNCGPWAFWDHHLHLSQDTPYVVTDADLIPADECPKDLIHKMNVLLDRYPKSSKVGPGLLFPGYAKGPGYGDELSEKKFWTNRCSPEAFFAAIDTTFAMYAEHAPFCNHSNNLRMDRPYVVKHTPHFFTEENLTEEEKYYRASSNKKWVNCFDRMEKPQDTPKVAPRIHPQRYRYAADTCTIDWWDTHKR